MFSSLEALTAGRANPTTPEYETLLHTPTHTHNSSLLQLTFFATTPNNNKNSWQPHLYNAKQQQHYAPNNNNSWQPHHYNLHPWIISQDTHLHWERCLTLIKAKQSDSACSNQGSGAGCGQADTTGRTLPFLHYPCLMSACMKRVYEITLKRW